MVGDFGGLSTCLHQERLPQITQLRRACQADFATFPESDGRTSCTGPRW